MDEPVLYSDPDLKVTPTMIVGRHASYSVKQVAAVEIRFYEQRLMDVPGWIGMTVFLLGVAVVALASAMSVGTCFVVFGVILAVGGLTFAIGPRRRALTVTLVTGEKVDLMSGVPVPTLAKLHEPQPINHAKEAIEKAISGKTD